MGEESASCGGEGPEGVTPGRDPELPEQAFDMRPDRVLGDEEALGNLVRREVLVEQEEYL